MTETWDLLQSPPADAVMNMAVDEGLLRTARERGRPLLRVYSWLKPAISIGYFQRFPQRLGGKCEIVRRPTGGGLVYHGEDTTYTVVVPPSHELHDMTTIEAYSAIHHAVGVALDVKFEIADVKSQTLRAGYECFQNPVHGDVVVAGRKLAGAAQRRSKWGLLHQGSIAVKLTARRLGDGFRQVLAAEFQPYELTTEERASAQWLATEKYAAEAWNKRIA
ncbi:MAG TPA: hypothetical protein VLZ12_09850 [Verrucomicrobiae bacterium]|nr:hypothetical protein [Verrucomicrobiae bacterium]